MIDNQRRLYAFESEASEQIVKDEPVVSRSDTEELEKWKLLEDCFPVKAEIVDCPEPAEQKDETRMEESWLIEPPLPAMLEQSSVCEQQQAEVRTKRFKNYSSEQLEGAIKAIDMGMSPFAAAKRFNVPRTTLRKQAQEKSLKRTRGCFQLNDDEELQVKIFATKRADSGSLCDSQDIINCVSRILKKRRREDRPGRLPDKWLQQFCDRILENVSVDSDENVLYSCDLCDFAVKGKKNLRIHMRLHTQKQEVQRIGRRHLQYSKEDFEQAIAACASNAMSIRAAAKFYNIPRSSLAIKVASNKKDPDGEVHKCAFCEKVFFTSGGKRNHEVTAHLTPVGEFPCVECCKVYSTNTQLKAHRKFVHVVGSYHCNQCGEVFQRQTSLNTHKAKHNPRIACEVCGKMVARGSNYIKHMKIHGPALHKCPFAGCTKVYHGKPAVDYHFHNTHAPKLSLQCSMCSSTFPNEGKLKIHVERSHTQPKFFCAVDGCGYKSTLREYLRLHLRNHKDIDVRLRDELILQIGKRSLH